MAASTRFEVVADELYAATRGEFVPLREERAAAARKRGEKDLANRIHRLRKPTTAAALVNLLARHHAEEVAELVRLGTRLRRAHQDLAGEAIRDLTRERNERIAALLERARAAESGELGGPVVRELEATLEAAVNDEESGRAVLEGRLTIALTPRDVFSAAWLPTESPTERQSEPSRSRRSKQRTQQRTEKRTAPTEARSERNRQRRAERERRDLEVRIRRDRDEARKRLRTAEKQENQARREAEAARNALETAERELRRLTEGPGAAAPE